MRLPDHPPHPGPASSPSPGSPRQTSDALDRRGFLRLGAAWAGAALIPAARARTFARAPSLATSQLPTPGSTPGPDGDWTWTNLAPARSPVGRSYSGVHYGDGRLMYFGGGHGSYPGNDVELYDAATDAWTQQYAPEICERSRPECAAIYGGSAVSFLSPAGRPYVLHTYQQIAWDPARRKFVAALRPAGTFTYDPDSATWTPIAGPHAPGNPFSLGGGDVHTHHLFAYDPDVKAILGTITAGSNNGVWILQADDKWARYGDNPVRDWEVMYSCHVASWKAHLVRCWKRWWRYEAVARRWTELPGPGTIDSFDYDSEGDVVVGIDHGSGPGRGAVQMWVLDCRTAAWTEVKPVGDAPRKLVPAPGAAPLLRYDPPRRRFLYLEASVGGGGVGGATRTFALRRATPGADASPSPKT